MLRTLRAKKFLLGTASSCCLLLASLAVVWALWPLPELPLVPTVMTSQSKRASAADAGRQLVSSEDFAQLWRMPLRAPLYDPPPVKPPKKTLPPLGVELLGTIIEPGNSLAMVSAGGSVEYKRVGESVGPTESPAQIVEILSDSVVLLRTDQRYTLRIDEGKAR